MGAWWQNLRLAHDSTLFSWVFDTYVDPGSGSYRSPNLVLVLQIWENLESNFPVCSVFIVVFSRPFVRISGDFSSIFGDFEAKLLSMSIYGFTSY